MMMGKDRFLVVLAVFLVASFMVWGCGPEEGSNGTGPVVVVVDDDAGHDDATTNGQPGEDVDLGDDAGPDQCPGSCSVGLTSCDGNGVRTCVADGACTAWSEVVACASGEVCSGGSCGETCQEICALGARQCSGGGYQICEANDSGCADWTEAANCPAGEVCSGGECSDTCTDACTDGATRCSGQAIETCEGQASGCLDWSSAEACPDGGACSSGECQGCTDGAERCGGDGSVQQCTNGTWHSIQACAFGCQNNECLTSVSCTAGEYRCNGDQVEVCNSGGTAYLHTSTCSVACLNGLCTGSCEPGDRRCNGDSVEECNDAGTSWTVIATCTTLCDASSPQCALESLEITNNTDLDGVVVVDGPVVIKGGATLRSPTGNLTIRAKSIIVELNGSIAIGATGQTPEGQGRDGIRCNISGVTRNGGGSGGGYGNAGAGVNCAAGGAIHGRHNDTDVVAGSRGGHGYGHPGSAGVGGGMLHLIADTIDVAGQISANGQPGVSATLNSQGGGGGGSGGGVLIAADQLTVSGTVMVDGGDAGVGTTNASSRDGGSGGMGRVKFLYGSSYSRTGTVVGHLVEALLPPLTVTSSTHPDEDRIYNDDFDVIALSWERAYPAVQGYYYLLDRTLARVPTPASGAFTADEIRSYGRESVGHGLNYFHITPVNAQSTVGTAEKRFTIRINETPPAVSSTSHASQTQWYENDTVFFQWSLPYANVHYNGYYYVLDQYGDTVPTKGDTFLPDVDQKQIIRSNLTPGIWAFHIVSADTYGYLTRAAGRHIVRIGPDPGQGTVLGSVTSQGSPVTNARVTINRGLLNPTVPDATTSATGGYNLGNIPVGTWEAQVTAEGYETKVQTIDVVDGESTTANFTLNSL
ncbi:MAG: carboxypeptidase regulatory-like domain-containing protein [Bradymonadaceae bacterium]